MHGKLNGHDLNYNKSESHWELKVFRIVWLDYFKTAEHAPS